MHNFDTQNAKNMIKIFTEKRSIITISTVIDFSMFRKVKMFIIK